MKKVAAIRDFFLAENSHDLKKAYQSLLDSFPGNGPVVADWQEVEFAFNRLFVGPAALEAPPFSSVYLNAEALVMNKTTMDVREMYAALGLESPWKNKLPDDHISLELDAALAMNHLAQQTDQPDSLELRKRFFTHMHTWVPLFCQRTLNASSCHPAIKYAVQCLSGWLDEQTLENLDS